MMPNLKIPLDSPQAIEAMRIMENLEQAGFTAYLAGGCVRDGLLGRIPKDYDIATNATPESVRQVFGKRNTLAFGASFGVIGVLPPRMGPSRDKSPSPTEVATFRSDGTYSDGRRPDQVTFGDAKADAMRRDFTINGMFYDPSDSKVIDFVGGQKDLVAQRIRTIGSPEERFGEDKLRMLRAIRFATTLEFDLEQSTAAAISQHAHEIVQVSGERIGSEMRRVVVSEPCCDGLVLLQQTSLAAHLMPTLDQMNLDEARSMLASIDDRCFPVSLACLAVSHPHPVQWIDRITKRWKLSNQEQRKTRAAAKRAEVLIRADQLPWSTVQPILIDRDAMEILQVARAIVRSQGLSELGLRRIDQALEWPRVKLDPPMLITGDDLQSAGIPAGPHYREWLQTLRDLQLDGRLSTVEDAWKKIDRLKR